MMLSTYVHRLICTGKANENDREWGKESIRLIEFKLSLLKSNISRLGLVLHAHVHGRRVR